MGEDEFSDLGCRECPPGFDRFGFGDFVQHRGKRLVQGYLWRDGTVSWITTDKRKPTRSGICLARSFLSHHTRQ